MPRIEIHKTIITNEEATSNKAPSNEVPKVDKPKPRRYWSPYTWEGHTFSTPQLRVLKALSECHGPINRTRLADKIGAKTSTSVGRAIGFIKEDKRAKFEQSQSGDLEGSFPSLLTLGLVSHVTLDIDGHTERGLMLTPLGREVVQGLGYIILPRLRHKGVKD